MCYRALWGDRDVTVKHDYIKLTNGRSMSMAHPET